MNHIWWIFALKAMLIGVYNPYAAVYAITILMSTLINGLFILVGNHGRPYRKQQTLQGFIARAHTWAFWFWAAIDVFTFFMFSYIVMMETLPADAVPKFAFSISRNINHMNAIFIMAATLLLYAISTGLLIPKLYEVFWQKNG